MITTIDNPFNPFTQFDDWMKYDEDQKYFTCPYLARIAYVNDDMPEQLYDEEVERAIDEICKLNILGIYKKVTRKDYENGNWKPISLQKLKETDENK